MKRDRPASTVLLAWTLQMVVFTVVAVLGLVLLPRLDRVDDYVFIAVGASLYVAILGGAWLRRRAKEAGE